MLGYFLDAADVTFRCFSRDNEPRVSIVCAPIAKRLAKLGMPIDVEPLLIGVAGGSGRSIGRPQIARAMVRAGHVPTRTRPSTSGWRRVVRRSCRGPDRLPSTSSRRSMARAASPRSHILAEPRSTPALPRSRARGSTRLRCITRITTRRRWLATVPWPPILDCCRPAAPIFTAIRATACFLEPRLFLTRTGSVFAPRVTDMASSEVLVQLRNVVKDFRGLRPLRIDVLDVRAGQLLAIVGVDQAMAEVLVDLITAAIAPDTGDVVVFGQSTRAISDRDAWLTTLDQFGLLTERAVLLDQLTVEQNLALPFSLALDDLSSAVREQVSTLAAEIGLAGKLTEQTGALSPALRLRVRLGRALALNPRVLLAEHPNATLSDSEQGPFAADLARILRARHAAGVVLTADQDFARAAADEVFALQLATGTLKPSTGWRRWFS